MNATSAVTPHLDPHRESLHMENVTFRCGHCNNLMAVSPTDVGQQVRCPHCQQVVIAPAPTPSPQVTEPQSPAPPATPPSPPPAPLPTFEFRPDTEHESIFSSSESEDPLFSGPTPRVEMPDESPVSPPAPPFSIERTPPLPPAVVPAPVPPASPLQESPTPPHEQTAPAFVDHSAPSPFHQAGEGHSDTEESALPTPQVRAPRSGGWYIPLFIVPLVSYSILATIAIFIMWRASQAEKPHPLEYLPDLEGDSTGVRKTKNERVQYKVPEITEELPGRLKLALGQTLRLGDLEVTPLRITQQQITIQTKGFNEETLRQPTLCLWLKLRNVASDITFAPLDRYFTREWKPLGKERASNSTTNPPFTYLELAGKRLYGGPTAWYPRGDQNHHYESVKGQDYFHELAPGEEWTTFVCVDPQENPLDLLNKTNGKEVLWRVQLRRGLARFVSPRNGSRAVPACAVIGVRFSARDVTPAS